MSGKVVRGGPSPRRMDIGNVETKELIDIIDFLPTEGQAKTRRRQQDICFREGLMLSEEGQGDIRPMRPIASNQKKKKKGRDGDVMT